MGLVEVLKLQNQLRQSISCTRESNIWGSIYLAARNRRAV